jgi:hypothetical protein
VLHIALGDVSCAITTHWQTLQGIAAIENEVGDPSITHATYNGMYVPRSLLVGTVRSSLGGVEDSSTDAAAAWSGPIETVVLSDNRYPTPPTDVTNTSSSSSAWDRYRVPTPAIAPLPPSYSSQGRQVNWDDEAEDMEEHDPFVRPTYVAPPESTAAVYPMDAEPSLPAPASDTEIPWTWYDHLRHSAPMHPQTCLDAPSDDWDGSALRDALWDRVRHMLEAGDQTPGLWLMQDTLAANAGTHLLHTWQDECARAPGAATLYIEETLNDDDEMSSGKRKQKESSDVIRHMCVLSEQTATSSLWMPLHCPDAMTVARALECATLCYRRPSAWAVRSTYAADDVDDTTHWTYRDFRRSLQRHAASRNVLELDLLSDSFASNRSLLSWLQPGTSVARDEREQSRLPASVDILAGDWMNGMANDIFWTCWTPPAPSAVGSAADRNRHYHYALSTSVRHAPIATDEMPKYVTSIMESMGIRYRPELALCAVVSHGLSYPAAPSVPTMAILGNTTRIYPYLHARATVTLPSYLRGSAMERDDVLEAQMACLDLRDSYAPPRGSGLVRPDDETEFDE